jgi:hypothetical protein
MAERSVRIVLRVVVAFDQKPLRSILSTASDPQMLHRPWMSKPINVPQLPHHHCSIIACASLLDAEARTSPDGTVKMGFTVAADT